MRSKFDVVVVGGGPSGSTAAHLLAQGGAKVLVLEREVFPRFHIGESLLPCQMEILARLGVDLTGHAKHMYKAGAEFFDEASGHRALYPFTDSLGGTRRHAWQVERATFDELLLNGAEKAGAEVHQGERVEGVELGADEVRITTDRGEHTSRYLIDATGQDSFLARRHRSRKRIDDFGLAAVFRHYHELKPEIAEELALTGAVKVFFVEEGWLWAIPLGGGRLSVGLVTRRKGIEDGWLDAGIGDSPELTRVLEGASVEGPHQRVGSFSFHNDRPHGARWVCVGDAACFLDPVFSSGVAFGMISAAHAADELLPALREGREGEARLMDPHVAHMTQAYNVFATVILSLYQRRLLPALFFTESQDSELRRGLTSILAGDVWREDNPFQKRLWASVRRRFEIPVPAAS